MTLPGPAAKGNSVIQRCHLPSPPAHTRKHAHTQPGPTFSTHPEGEGKTRDDYEGIDREVSLHSLRTLATTGSIRAFIFFTG